MTNVSDSADRNAADRNSITNGIHNITADAHDPARSPYNPLQTADPHTKRSNKKFRSVGPESKFYNHFPTGMISLKPFVPAFMSHIPPESGVF